MSTRGHRSAVLFLNNAPFALFVLVLATFSLLSPKFLHADTVVNVLVQSSSTAVVAIGMTFVLLTAGVDLSVGAIMFLSGALGGKLVLAGAPIGVALLVILIAATLFGLLNGLLITRLGIVAFIVTLATLYLGRGLALWVTETRAMNLPSGFLDLGSARLWGIPLPILVFAVVLGIAHLVLTRTPFGKHVYAVGNDRERAAKAGIHTVMVLTSVYIISGACAGIGAILSLAQLGSVSPTFGVNKEFAAIAAAVLGGTSLFGGRGNVLPGTFLGAILIQSVENGLVILNADPYLYPIVTSAIIFVAVLIDSVRTDLLSKLSRRKIRIEPP
jgi:ribose transport system permease protein